MMIGCDIHPLNNLRVLDELRSKFGADDASIAEWFRMWVDASFKPLETRLMNEPGTGEFCHGDEPGLADICLAAQVINNTRFNVDMSIYPTIQRIHDSCMDLDHFKQAAPAAQPDAE